MSLISGFLNRSRNASRRSSAVSWLVSLVLSLLYGFVLCAAAQATNPPAITPATGVYSTYQSTATITAEPGATIFYTVDGSQPSHGSPVYSSAITLTNPMTIKAMASLSGVDSTVATACCHTCVKQ